MLTALDPPADSPVLNSVLRGWISMVETMGRGWLRHGQPTREELETLLPELLRAVLGAAAWHDPATAATLPRLPPFARGLAASLLRAAGQSLQGSRRVPRACAASSVWPGRGRG